MKKVILVSLAFAVLVAVVAPQSAEAGCYYPRRHVREHIGFYDINGNPNCPVIIGPQPTYTEVIGEEVWDCDGSYSSWGITSCAWNITNDYFEACEPICDEPQAANEENAVETTAAERRVASACTTQ